MKNFINVLYRRILYKIPLKLLLVLLAIFWLLFACTKAWLVEIDRTTYSMWSYNDWHYTNSDADLNCLQLVNCSSQNAHWLAYNFDRWLHAQYLNWNHELANSYGSCTSWDIYFGTDWTTCSFQIASYVFDYYTSQQCQTEYNLIPISSVDQNYCTTNNLCPSWWTPSDCPNVWVSNLWINDLFHPWAFNIVMNIPEEIDRDYAYTNSWQNMNIDVVWYNVDYDYIDWVVDSQNYKPNSDDLSSIVSQIIPLFVPWLCIILLLYFIFRFIKKIF